MAGKEIYCPHPLYSVICFVYLGFLLLLGVCYIVWAGGGGEGEGGRER